jgi:hypothetical protein
MAELLRRLLWIATGGVPRLILKRKETSFTVSALRGKSPTNIAALLRKSPKLTNLTNLPAESLSVLRVPVSQLCDTRLLLQHAVDLPFHIEIAPDVLGLSRVDCPREFAVVYEWTRQGLTRHFTIPAEYCEAGWFVSDSHLWRLPATVEDDEWLRLPSVVGDKAIQFLRNVLPDWRRRDLPIRCPITYADAPAIQARISRVTDNTVDLSVSWCNDPQKISSTPTLDDHVMVDNTVRPGIAPQNVDFLGNRQELDVTLEGEDIPKFIRELLPQLRNWTTGAVSELFQQHQILDIPAAILLRIERAEKDGIGTAVAIPELVCGDVSGNAEQISYALNEARGFVRVGRSWISVATIKNAGLGPFGRAINGTVLGRTTLTPTEVLSRTLRQLNTPWPVHFPAVEYPVLADDLNAHLSFLLYWGIPGGIAADPEKTTEALRICAARLKSNYSQAKVLVIASKARIEETKAAWGALVTNCLTGSKTPAPLPNNVAGIFLSQPKALEEIPQLGLTPWTLLILLEADALIKTAHSSFFEQVCRCEALLTICSFTSTAFLAKNAQREALARVLRIPSGSDGELVWKYGVRDPQVAPERLPPLSRPTAVRHKTSEHVVGEPSVSGIPIPLRTSTASQHDLEKLGIRIQITYSTSDDNFLEAARKMSDYKAGVTQPVPFEAYRPTYSLMSAQQKNWYLYWRSQVRNGIYPDVDLTYIFLHIYELIHQVGARDTEDGYRQLRALWHNYRDRHSRLDSYMADWLADYILINHCHIDPLQPYTELLSFGRSITQPDLLLQRYINGGDYCPPLGLLLSYSNYNLCRSRFYNDETKALLNERLPQAFVYLDQARLCPDKKTLVEAYRPMSTKAVSRTPFLGAIYAEHRESITLGVVYPYSFHAPFRAMVTSFFKYSENKLRQALKHKALLRGIDLPTDMQPVLQAYFVKYGLSASPTPRIEIDITRVQALQAESDEIREMLLMNSVRSGMAAETSIGISPGEAADMSSSNSHSGQSLVDSVSQFLRSLTEPELGFIWTLMNLGWESDDQLIKIKIGDCFLDNMIERINQLSLRDLGDVLVVTEAGRRIVSEDFRHEIDSWFTHSGKSLVHPSSEQNGLPAEWHELRSHLDNGQRLALTIISAEQDVNQRLEHIAKQLGSMPELLVESINETAMNTIGDIIVDLAVSPPVLEQENRELVEKMLALE